MAVERYDDWESYFDSDELSKGELQDLANDSYLEGLMDRAFFDDTDFNYAGEFGALLEEIKDYLLEEYDLVFDDIFDWDDWRDAYSGD